MAFKWGPDRHLTPNKIPQSLTRAYAEFVGGATSVLIHTLRQQARQHVIRRARRRGANHADRPAQRPSRLRAPDARRAENRRARTDHEHAPAPYGGPRHSGW